jgi:nitroreductase
MDKEPRNVLKRAASEAQLAPSIFNTQPWRWRLVNDELHLQADRSRRLHVTDPDQRQLTISCGAALHHAIVALAAAGYDVEVSRRQDPGDGDLLAVVRVAGTRAPSENDLRLHQAIPRRRTDRRAYTAENVESHTISNLVAAAENQGAHLHIASDDQVKVLREAAIRAEQVHLADISYKKELAWWTHRPPPTRDGVPPLTAVMPTDRRVPLRSLALPGVGISPGLHDDVATIYALVFTDTDERLDWLRAGEALSAMLLSATAVDLAASPISDVIEVPETRTEVSHILDGPQYAQIAVRIGHPPMGELSASPRRPAEVIET